jgi:hypothetical protein
MATKQEIIAAIRQGQERVRATFGRLSAEQLAMRVHDDEGDRWTAKHVLAHLAGRAAGYTRMMQLGQRQPPTPPPGARFDVNEWNRQQVEQRIDRPATELLREFRQVHDDLIRQVEALPDETLDRVVPHPAGERPLGEVLMMSGGTHSVNHTATVERALGLPEPGR